MGRIVDDALDLSKIEAGKMQIESVAFNIKKLCLSLASGYKTKALNQGIVLQVEVSERLPHTLYSDPTRLRQIVSNLLSNGQKYKHTHTHTHTHRKNHKKKTNTHRAREKKKKKKKHKQPRARSRVCAKPLHASTAQRSCVVVCFVFLSLCCSDQIHEWSA